MIRYDPEIFSILGEERADRIIRLLAGKTSRPVVHQIVSGPLDADKQDYLLRDSLFCGVPYGVFDLEQLHRSFRIGGEDGDKLVIDEDAIHAVEQFTLAKYFMTGNVYRHKIRMISDQMLSRAIQVGIDLDELDELKTLYSYDGSDGFIENYCKWDDARFFSRFSSEGGSESRCTKLIDRLRFRRLFKRVFHQEISSFPLEARDALTDISSNRTLDSLRQEIEEEAAKIIKKVAKNDINSWETIVHAWSIKSVRESAQNDTQGIVVEKHPDEWQLLDQTSPLFGSIDAAENERFIDIYASVEWGDHAERNKTTKKLDKPLRELLERLGSQSFLGGTS